MEDRLTLRIKNELSGLSTLTQAFSEFRKKCPIPEKVSNSVELVLDEVISNIISYAHEEQGRYFIDITISIEGEQVVIEICDDGKKFNPLEVQTPDTESELDKRPVGGLGLHIVRNVMDEVYYNYSNNRNCLLIKKKLRET